MWRYEIAWEEAVAGASFPITKHRGFTSRENYEKFARRLQRKGARIIGRIEEFVRIQ